MVARKGAAARGCDSGLTKNGLKIGVYAPRSACLRRWRTSAISSRRAWALRASSSSMRFCCCSCANSRLFMSWNAAVRSAGALALELLQRRFQVLAPHFDRAQERGKGETTDIGIVRALALARHALFEI